MDYNKGCYLNIEKPGYVWNSWVKRWVVVKEDGLYCFDSELSCNIMECILLDHVSSISPSTENDVFVVNAPPTSFRFQAEDQVERDSFVLFLSDQKTSFISTLIKKYSHPEERKLIQLNNELDGNVQMLINGYVYIYWSEANLCILDKK